MSNAVTLYSKPACQGCRLTAKRLDSHGIEYTYRDITEDPDAYAAVQALGYQSVPVVVAGDEHWAGFKPHLIDALKN